MRNLKLLKRCTMAAIIIASTAFAANGDATGPAPAFTLNGLSGQPGALSQYKGQVVMVNFWATWCGPCQQEMPLLDQMYKKYKPAGFTLIGVNVDKEAPAVKELLARKPVSFPVLLDPANQVSKAYHVDEMPSSVIIDRKGEIRYIHRGYRPGDENEYQDRIRQSDSRVTVRVSATLALIFAGMLLGACSIQPWVKPYERDRLADPIMSWDRDAISGAYLDHIYESREGSRGATGTAGGGCGCN